MNTKQELRSAAVIPIYTNAALILVQLSAGMAMKSISVISFGIDTVIDLFIAVICILGIEHASRPASEKHPYGYGKAENVANLFVSVSIFLAAAYLIFESVANFIKSHQVGHIWLGVAILIVSSATNFWVSGLLLRKAKKLESSTLEYQGINLKIDAWTSAAIAGGLIVIRFTGLNVIDSALAVLIVAALVKTGYDILRKSILELLDIRLPEKEEKEIMEVIQAHAERFVGFHKLNSRKSGRHRHIEVHLVMCKSQSVLSLHEISRTIEEGIKKKFPDSTVIIKAEPCTVLHSDCKGKCSTAQGKGYHVEFTASDAKGNKIDRKQ